MAFVSARVAPVPENEAGVAPPGKMSPVQVMLKGRGRRVLAKLADASRKKLE